MVWLVIGLIVFFSIHSVRIINDDFSSRFIAEKSKLAWRGPYGVLSLLGLGLIIYGFGEARADPVFLWNPPLWTRHAAALLVFIAFLLLAAGNIPRNHIKQKLGHPMFAGTKIWAFAHLIANGSLGDTLLFGCFLIWAIAGFSVSRRRDRKAGVIYEQGSLFGTAMVSSAATVLYAIFAFFLHRLLIGVSPF